MPCRQDTCASIYFSHVPRVLFECLVQGPEQLDERRHPVLPEYPRLVTVARLTLFVLRHLQFKAPSQRYTCHMPRWIWHVVCGAMLTLTPSNYHRYLFPSLFAPTWALIRPNGLLKFRVPCTTFTYATRPGQSRSEAVFAHMPYLPTNQNRIHTIPCGGLTKRASVEGKEILHPEFRESLLYYCMFSMVFLGPYEFDDASLICPRGFCGLSRPCRGLSQTRVHH
ncbi:hypothetical protein EDB87DRAFT_1261457 [Lactarius vividus]|nr:hypothetical protein EDB87DRAFT_1261457 [Lactarius vividus]